MSNAKAGTASTTSRRQAGDRLALISTHHPPDGALRTIRVSGGRVTPSLLSRPSAPLRRRARLQRRGRRSGSHQDPSTKRRRPRERRPTQRPQLLRLSLLSSIQASVLRADRDRRDPQNQDQGWDREPSERARSDDRRCDDPEPSDRNRDRSLDDAPTLLPAAPRDQSVDEWLEVSTVNAPPATDRIGDLLPILRLKRLPGHAPCWIAAGEDVGIDWPKHVASLTDNQPDRPLHETATPEGAPHPAFVYSK